jgi:hypothetical protein
MLLSVRRGLTARTKIESEELNYERAVRILVCMRGAKLRTENMRTLAARIGTQRTSASRIRI